MVVQDLRPFDADGSVRMVVEAPRGSALKLKYDPELSAFAYGRPLPLGLTYPFDWGFVRSLPARLREEIEQFFLSTTFFEQKDARIEGWRGAAHAKRLVRAAERRFAGK